jgi:hypothetical protein
MYVPDDATRARYPGVEGASVVPRCGVLTLSEQRAVWTLVPFTHPQPKRLAKFVAKAARALRMPKLPCKLTLNSSANQLRTALADPRRRRALAKAFRAAQPDQNLSSMALYAGPALSEQAACCCRVVENGDQSESGAVPRRLGWLGTGDAPLKSKARARAFEKFYGNLLPRVGTFVVPHHGSRRNFAATLFQAALERTDWVVAVGDPSRAGHPDKALMKALRARGIEHRVTQHPGTEFVEVISIVHDLARHSR